MSPLRLTVSSSLLFLAPTISCIEATETRDPPVPAQPVAEQSPRASTSPPRFVPAGAGDVREQVVQALREAKQDGARVVVYVGAAWCEPCRAFHEALEAGQLDEQLAGIRFLEFDSDRSGAALEAAGYGGRLIPRFILPNEDGSAGAKSEGAMKGERAVGSIVRRLQPMLRAQLRKAGK